MKKFLLLSLTLVLLTGCATMQRAGLAGLGAAGGSFLGPAGAAVGAVGGVIASDVITAQGDPQKVLVDAAGEAVGAPQGTIASTVHESKNFIQTIGWWYLIIFILVPLFTKKGRSWIANLATLHNTATKKDVDSAAERLHKVEGLISSLNKENK
jgi:hypothetical protein